MTLVRIGDVGLVQIPKAGSRGIRYAARNAGLAFDEIGAGEFNSLPVRVVNLRDPRSRLEAAFRMYVSKGRLIVQLWPTGSFEEFVLAVCRKPSRDRHTQLMSDYIAGVDLTHILKWDFAKLAELLGTKDVPKIGSSPPAPCDWTEASRTAFDKAYASDIALWFEPEPHR